MNKEEKRLIKNTTKVIVKYVEQHQYLKANPGSYECVCGEVYLDDCHYDKVGDWSNEETWKDKCNITINLNEKRKK